MAEGRKGCWWGALCAGEFPGEGQGTRHHAKVGLARVRDGLGISVLHAHHFDCGAIGRHFLSQVRVAVSKSVERSVKDIQLLQVVLSQLVDLLNKSRVNSIVLIGTLELIKAFVYSLSKLGNRLSDSLRSNKHVSGLGSLQLITMLTEQSSFSIEIVNCHIESGNSGVCR